MPSATSELSRRLADGRAAAGAVALVGAHASLRSAELYERADRLRTWLAELGLGPGARLLVATADPAVLQVALAAGLAAGISVVVADAAARPRELDEICRLATPAAGLVDEAVAGVCRDRLPALIVVGGPRRSLFDRLLGRAPAAGFLAGLAAHPPAGAAPAVDDELEAYVVFTSGSTGRGKGVCISRRALAAHLSTLVRVTGYAASSRVMALLPTHHADGFLPLVLPLVIGCCVLRPLEFTAADAGAVLDAIYRERASHFLAVPTMLRFLLDAAGGREDSLRGVTVVSMAGPLPEPLWRSFEERFDLRLSNFYGLSETVTGSLYCGPDDATYRRGSVGKPIDCEARVADGELHLRGPHLMSGYLGEDDGSALRADGWLATGDLAELDAEGFVHLVGRSKNVVVSAGHNLQPEEIAAALERLPGVAEAVCFGLPDPAFGEILAGLVVARAGAILDEAGLIEGLRAELSAYKLPRGLAVVPALPRGPAGKVQVPAAVELYRSQRRGFQPLAGEDLRAQVWRVASQAFRVPVERLAEASSPGDTPGWDSFAHLELVTGLETTFGVRLSPADIGRLRSLGDAARIVRERLAG